VELLWNLAAEIKVYKGGRRSPLTQPASRPPAPVPLASEHALVSARVGAFFLAHLGRFLRLPFVCSNHDVAMGLALIDMLAATSESNSAKVDQPDADHPKQ